MQLEKDGQKCTSIHGDLDPAARDRVVNEFRDGKTRVLIATDVLSRGFDVQQVCFIWIKGVQVHSPSYPSTGFGPPSPLEVLLCSTYHPNGNHLSRDWSNCKDMLRTALQIIARLTLSDTFSSIQLGDWLSNEKLLNGNLCLSTLCSCTVRLRYTFFTEVSLLQSTASNDNCSICFPCRKPALCIQ